MKPNSRKIKTVLLVENKLSVEENIKILGFKPYVYSPEFILLNNENITFLHKKKIRVIPWTVNEISDMQKLIDLKVEGLISDYPNRYFEMKNNK